MPGKRTRAVGAPEEVSVVAEMARILDTPPDLAPFVLRGDTRLTRRFRHGSLHDSLPALNGHVVMTYYSQPRDIVWQSGRERIAATTRPGSVTLIPDSVDGHWDIQGEIEVSHVYLTGERLNSCASALTGGKAVELVARVGFDDPVTSRILELLARETATDDASSRLFVEQGLDLLCTQLVRGHSSFGAFPSRPRRGLAPWQLRRVTEYMRDKLHEDVGLDELAAVAGLSRFHFCTAFRLATGQTPHEWLTRERIEKARAMLAMPGATVTEVALSVGYNTPSAFAVAFRRLTGTTPSAFRRER